MPTAKRQKHRDKLGRTWSVVVAPLASAAALDVAFWGALAPVAVHECMESALKAEALLDPKLIIQLGVAPVRVDVLSHFATLSFADAWRTRVDAKFGAIDAHYLGRAQLIAEKQHFDRPQDRADVAVLLAQVGRAKVRRAKHGRRA